MESATPQSDQTGDNGQLDLAQLARALHSRLGTLSPSGYLEGKTALRDMVIDLLDDSMLDAEELVDLLERYGFVEFDADPADREGAAEGHWYVNRL